MEDDNPLVILWRVSAYIREVQVEGNESPSFFLAGTCPSSFLTELPRFENSRNLEMTSLR
jgi:hypothetical protein